MMSPPSLPLSNKPVLLVLTSTYPRWRDDAEPGFVHELARRLTDRFEVTVLCPHAAGALAEEDLDGVHVVRYRYAPARWESLVNDGGILANLRRAKWKWALVPIFLLAQWWVLRRLTKNLRPKAIHAHWLIPQGIVATFASINVPLIVTSHGADLFAIPGRFFAALRARVLRRSCRITVVSEAMRDRLKIEHPGAAAEVMPMGIDFTSLFTPDESIGRSRTSILFVGRLVEKKGCAYLIDALPAVLDKYPTAELNVVGFGPERMRLEAKVAALGLNKHVKFSGPVKQRELPALFRAASICVAPFIEAPGGDQEGLGLVVAEAIGCHCPVIVGDVPAVKDLLEGAPELIVPQADVVALAAAIVAVLDNSVAAAKRATHLREHLQLRLSWSAIAEKYAQLINDAIGQ